MDSPVVLVTSSVPVRDAVERALARLHTPVWHELSASSGVAVARQSASVVICTLEADWRGLIRALQAGGEVGAPVILLIPQSDPRMWAEALMDGAFDALAMTEGPDRLINAVQKARARWMRAQSVREALKQNTAVRVA